MSEHYARVATGVGVCLAFVLVADLVSQYEVQISIAIVACGVVAAFLGK